MDAHRKTYILRVWYAAPAESNTGRLPDEASETVAERDPQPGERFYCSLQAIASEEIHYFASLEETIHFIRSNAFAFRFKPE